MRKVLLLFLLCLPGSLALNISFFEEFPTTENLEKVEMVPFETKVYVAAESLEDFYLYEEKLRQLEHGQEVIYWPVLSEEEGYWFSPWMDQNALRTFVNSTLDRNNSDPLSVMLDFEPPKKRWDMLRNDKDSPESKRIIEQFLLAAPGFRVQVYAIEMTHAPVWLLEGLGFSYDSERYQVKKIRMYYSSFRRAIIGDALGEWFFRREARRCARSGEILGIGLIATGIYLDEPVYDASVLARELKIAQEEGVKEIIIFRLGGVDEKVSAVL